MKQEHPELESPYKRGARDGFYLGIYFTVMMGLSLASGNGLAVLGMISTLMMAATPVVAFMMLRRYYAAEGGHPTVSTMWMMGIVAFSCGAIICFSIMLVYMKWINPDYLTDSMMNAIGILEQSGDSEMQALAGDMSEVMKNGNPLTPVSFCFTMIWATIFTGSILSLILAAIAKGLPLRRRG